MIQKRAEPLIAVTRERSLSLSQLGMMIGDGVCHGKWSRCFHEKTGVPSGKHSGQTAE
jgi:hypothetical protein